MSRDRFRCVERSRVRSVARRSPERRGGVPQVQAGVGGGAGSQRADQLSWHGHDDGQAALHGQEMAGRL